MNKLYLFLTTILVVIVAFATEIFMIDATGLVALANAPTLLPKGFSDPDRLKRWSQLYFRRVESKVVFDESYTGTTLAKDGPKESDLVTAAPIVLINDLKNRKGTQVTHTLINPLFPNSSARLNYGRVKGQKRVDSEKSGSKNFVTVPLGTWFQGVKEEDILIGKQEIGMGQMYKLMVELLSDNGSQYMDDDTIETFHQGHSRHLYHTVAETLGLADGAKVVGNVDAGIRNPAEHPNTFAWVPSGTGFTLKKADSNSVEDVHKLFSEIDSTCTASEDLLRSIQLRAISEKIVPTTYMPGKGYKKRGLVKVLIDPFTMEDIRKDMKESNAFNAAFEGTKYEHPMIDRGDLIFGNLHICEEEKLIDPAFSPANNFGADAYTDAAFGAVTESQIRRVTTGYGEDVYLEHGQRTFAAGTAAGDDAAIGENGANKLGHIIVLGANSIARVPGPVLPLIERTEDDYRRIVGLGAEHLFGAKRIDFVDHNRDFDFNQSSIRVTVYRNV